MTRNLAYALVLTIGAGVAAYPAQGSAQVYMTRHDVSVDAALRLIQAARAECKTRGADVSVVVLGLEGDVRASVRANAASLHNYELARRKAYTARTFQRPSSEWIALMEKEPALAGQKGLDQVIPLSGGVPIKLGAETIGSVGVSGSPIVGVDEACAAAAAASLAADLK